MKTIDELIIFWSEADGQVEASGIYFYGFWGPEAIPNSFFEMAGLWKAIESTTAFQQIVADGGNFLVMTIRIKSWPADPIWRSAVEETLTKMIAMRAKVAWCGGENCSWSLTELNPATYSGCIYAASSVNRQPILYSELSSGDLVFLRESDIVALGDFTKSNLNNSQDHTSSALHTPPLPG